MLTTTFAPFPILITERLELRALKMEDAPEIFFLRSDANNNKYVDRPKAITIEDAKDFIKKIITGIEKSEVFYWAITLKNKDQLIGTICLWNISFEKDTAELGYDLIPDFQGQGIMQEAITEVVRFCFTNLKLSVITAFTHPENEKSIQVLERNNFKLDSNFKYASEEEAEGLACYFLKQP